MLFGNWSSAYSKGEFVFFGHNQLWSSYACTWCHTGPDEQENFILMNLWSAEAEFGYYGCLEDEFMVGKS
jgi:hypothetical protein